MESAARPVHPGDLSREDWSQRQDVVHHGTYRKDWEQGTAAHFAGNDPEAGPRSGVNVSRGFLNNGQGSGQDWSSYGPRFDPEVEDPDEFLAGIGQGRIHSRRLEADVPSKTGFSAYAGPLEKMSDEDANLAHAAHGYLTEGEYPSKPVGDSVPHRIADDLEHDPEWVFNDDFDDEDPGAHWSEKYPAAERGRQALGQGKSIVYDNIHEGGISAVVPRGGGRTYEQDLIDSPNRLPYTKDLVAQSVRQVGPLSTPVPQKPLHIGQQERLVEPTGDGGGATVGGGARLESLWSKREPVRSYPKPRV